MYPHLWSWEHFSDLFHQAIWRGILDSVQALGEPLPTFVARLVTKFKRLKQPAAEK